MADPSGDYASRAQEYKQRLENLLVEAQGAIDRQAPDVLDRMAATARNIARRLDDMARDARQRAEEQEATPESRGTSPSAPQPENQAPSSSGGSDTAAA
jgi:hypothetical protein